MAVKSWAILSRNAALGAGHKSKSWTDRTDGRLLGGRESEIERESALRIDEAHNRRGAFQSGLSAARSLVNPRDRRIFFARHQVIKLLSDPISERAHAVNTARRLQRHRSRSRPLTH
jgi:hypothetical protein